MEVVQPSGRLFMTGRVIDAKVYVFDAATGVLLQELPSHEDRIAKPGDYANQYIQSEVATFLASIGPKFSNR
jgi:hypothetical protein